MSRGARSALGALIAMSIASTLLWTAGTGAGTTALALPRQITTAAVPATASVPMAPAAATDVAAIRALLHRRASALLGRDEAAFTADLGTQRPGFRQRQAALFANLAQVPLQTWSYRISRSALLANAQVGGASAAGQQTLTFKAELSYQLAGFDRYPDVHPVILTFTRTAATAPWKLVSDSDYDRLGTPTWRGLWDFGPVVVLRSTYGLLLAHPAQAKLLASFGRAVDKAVPAVRAIWGVAGWPGKVVVLMPGSSTELARVGSVGVGLDRLAAVAVATSVDVDASRATGQRVLINPAALGKLGPPAALSLMTHEITHVAARASTREGTPTWLVEGLADYVAYSRDSSPPEQVAVTLAAQVQGGDVPDALPTDADFRTGADSLNAVYAQAWLACKYIVSRVGLGSLITLYRTVAGSVDPGPTQAEQLATRLGQTKSQFTAAWIGYLKAQLG